MRRGTGAGSCIVGGKVGRFFIPKEPPRDSASGQRPRDAATICGRGYCKRRGMCVIMAVVEGLRNTTRGHLTIM